MTSGSVVLVLLCSCDGLSTVVGVEPPYVSPTPTHATSSIDWAGEPIGIGNDNGNVDVVGVLDAKRIEVDAYPVALAKNQADAAAAWADVAAQIVVTKTDAGFTVLCPSATADHGSALIAGTGCARLVVRVPAGSASQPASLNVHAKFGGAQVAGVTGSVIAYATFDVHASVAPTKGATVSLANGNDGTTLICPVVLVVPPSFQSSDLLVESHHDGSRVLTDFPDLMVSTCDRAMVVASLQATYPGSGPFPCISSAGPHAQGLDRAARLEVLGGDGDAYFVRNEASAPAWTGGKCNCNGVSLCDPTPAK